MSVTIKHQSEVDKGTGEFEKQGGASVDLAADLEGPTGEAKSTLQREMVMEEHKGEPTGEAEPQRSVTSNADWPTAKEVKATENKEVKATSSKTTAKKTTRRKSN